MKATMPLKFHPKLPKIVELLLYLAHNRPGADKYQAVKFFYLADRLHLQKYGRPITNEDYFAFWYGPVASNALNLIQGDKWVMRSADLKKLPFETLKGTVTAETGFSMANYESTLLGWTGWQDGQATKTIQPNVTFGFGISRVQRYSQAAAARQWMITQRGAIIIDGGDVFIASIQAVVGVDGIIAHMKTALVGVMGETGVQGFVSYLKQIGISLESVVGVQGITPAGTKITTQNLLASVNVAGDIPQGRKTALTTVMGEVFVFGQVAGEMREGTWMLEEVHFTLGNSTGMLTSSTKLYHDQTMRLVITVQDFPSLIGAQVVLRYRHDFGDIQEIKNHVLTPLVLTGNTVSVRFNFAAGSYLMWLWITFPDGSSLPTSTVKFRVHEEGT